MNSKFIHAQGNHMQAEKDTAAFLTAIEAHRRIIYKVANSYCSDEAVKKDLIQEIIVQLWLSFEKYNEQYQLSTWIYRIALNVAISFYRKEKKRTEINQPIPPGIMYVTEEAETEIWDQNLQLLQQFISELKELDRALILLFLEGYAHQEIGEILGLSVTHVSTKMHRIKQKLRQKFSTSKNR